MKYTEKPDVSQFSAVLEKFLYFGVNPKKLDDSRLRIIAEKFDVALSTVLKWKNGTATPHDLVKVAVMQYIAELSNA